MTGAYDHNRIVAYRDHSKAGKVFRVFWLAEDGLPETYLGLLERENAFGKSGWWSKPYPLVHDSQVYVTRTSALKYLHAFGGKAE